jgi:hypothetical protein
VKVPLGFGKAETSKERSPSIMVHLKRSIVKVNTEEECGVRIVDSIAKMTNDRN